MTPYELLLYGEDYNRRTEREWKEKVTLVYAGAAWQRAKRMPNLKKLLGEKTVPKKQTPEQMLAEIKRLTRQMGGTIVEKGGEI